MGAPPRKKNPEEERYVGMMGMNGESDGIGVWELRLWEKEKKRGGGSTGVIC